MRSAAPKFPTLHLWMSAPIGEALAFQRPLPDDSLKIVASGKQEDLR
jgi:hypothetical protein